jgi:hypothetical protein
MIVGIRMDCLLWHDANKHFFRPVATISICPAVVLLFGLFMPVNRPEYSFLESENKDELKSDARSAFDKARESDLNSDPRAALPKYWL